MTDKHVLTREQMKATYPDQWLLVTDCELDPASELEFVVGSAGSHPPTE